MHKKSEGNNNQPDTKKVVCDHTWRLSFSGTANGITTETFYCPKCEEFEKRAPQEKEDKGSFSLKGEYKYPGI